MSLTRGYLMTLRTGSKEVTILAETSLISCLIYSRVKGLSTLVDNGLFFVIILLDERPRE